MSAAAATALAELVELGRAGESRLPGLLASCHSASISSMSDRSGVLPRSASGAFDVAEALAELGVGAAQRLLGIDFDEARQVDQHEEQIAQFVFQFRLRSALRRASANSASSSSSFSITCRHFPSRSRRRRPRGDLLRFHQRRQRARDGVQQAAAALRPSLSSRRL